MRAKEEDLRSASTQISLTLIVAAWLLIPGCLQAALSQELPPASPSPPAGELTVLLPPGSTARGEALFAGTARFERGGPPCKSCHSIAGLPFPNGGTLGPNLTGVYKKLGPHGMQVSMKTLYFHVMTPIYDPHPLTLQERSDLIAFFKEAATQPQPRWNTEIIVSIAFIGFLILLAMSGFVWRDRLKSVRKNLVERAMREGEISS